MKFYLKVNEQTKIIEDAITYKHDGYMEVEYPELPIGINAGYYRWEMDQPILDEELKKEADKKNLPQGYLELASKLELLQKAMDDMILKGGTS
ncbi:hypothetical protein [Paenibacillus pini]|uniref:Uncharacterized protein n=1 Tax=Paenibacillus pini JCM 16418 TaxID=1236976 RepID=W7YGK6_9BACL|nr:hypothetical protein [Paenibacillus pini]GAF07582.1 hypothetical protein JCM16418_1608 [Paenibacillus pini JCM 16418]